MAGMVTNEAGINVRVPVYKRPEGGLLTSVDKKDTSAKAKSPGMLGVKGPKAYKNRWVDSPLGNFIGKKIENYKRAKEGRPSWDEEKMQEVKAKMKAEGLKRYTEIMPKVKDSQLDPEIRAEMAVDAGANWRVAFPDTEIDVKANFDFERKEVQGGFKRLDHLATLYKQGEIGLSELKSYSETTFNNMKLNYMKGDVEEKTADMIQDMTALAATKEQVSVFNTETQKTEMHSRADVETNDNLITTDQAVDTMQPGAGETLPITSRGEDVGFAGVAGKHVWKPGRVTGGSDKNPSAKEAFSGIAAAKKRIAMLEKGDKVDALLAKEFPEMAGLFGEGIPPELKKDYLEAEKDQISYLEKFAPKKKKKIVREGVLNGRKVVEYNDGSIEYTD